MGKGSIFKLCYSSDQVMCLFSKLTVLNTQPVVFMFTHLYVNVAVIVQWEEALNLEGDRPGRGRVGRENEAIIF